MNEDEERGEKRKREADDKIRKEATKMLQYSKVSMNPQARKMYKAHSSQGFYGAGRFYVDETTQTIFPVDPHNTCGWCGITYGLQGKVLASFVLAAGNAVGTRVCSNCFKKMMDLYVELKYKDKDEEDSDEEDKEPAADE